MTKKKPQLIEFIVTGNAKLRGVTTTVHAYDRQEAIRKANAGEYIGGIDLDVGEMVDYDFHLAEPNCDVDG